MAIEAQLADGRILEFPDGTDPSVVQATVKRVIAQSAPPIKTTAFGNVKEAFKGLVPGAVGLLEGAATGASALLPEDMEKSAREKIKSVATAAKAPFTAAPGYEDTIPRKLSEAVGSTLPFLAAGPFGLAGRAAAVGLGVGAGAGESRTRAEESGATGEQRSTATALGIIPGALEAFAPLRILSRIPTASKAAGVEAVKRALVAGGEEAAQEAASGFAQNLIAKGVYKPEQALIDGLGEQAAYGGATGAIVQGLMDLALGRRARGAQTPPPPPAQPGPQLAPEASAGTQGTLFTPEEMGKPVPAPKAPAEPAATAVPAGQEDLGLDYQREYADMAKERERLRQQPQTPEVKARVQELTGQMALYTQSDIESMRAEKEGQAAAAAEDAKARQKFPALAGAPDLLTQPDEVKARTQSELFPGEELAGPTLREKEKPAAEKPAEPTPVPPYARTGDYQYKLPLRGGEVAEPLTMQNVLDTGVAPSTTKGWFEQNVVGKTQAEVQALVDATPALIDGPGKRAKILRELLAPQAAPFKETPRVEPTPTPPPAVEQRNEPRAGKPSVGVPSKPAAPIVPEPGAGAPVTAEAPATPDGRGLVPAGRPAVQGDDAQGAKPTAVTPPVAAPAPSVAPQSPDVDSIKSFPVGPARVTPTVIARDKPTYHETNAEGLEDFARNDKQFEYSGAFVSDNPDLALGQGSNTGVFIEFRPNSISGKVHAKLGTSPATGQEYKSDVVAPKAISVVTIKDPASFKPGRMTARLLKAEFDKETLPDGSVQYTRKGVAASKALPITQAPEIEPTAPPAVTETKDERRTRLRAEKAEREEKTTHEAVFDGKPVVVEIIRDKTKELRNNMYPVVEIRIKGATRIPMTMAYGGYQTDAEVLAFLRENETIESPPAPAAPAVEAETDAEEAARKAEAEDFKRRLEALEKAKPVAPKAAPAPTPAPKAEKPEPKEIPDKLREPVGKTDFGGEDTILRGPQGMLFPMSKREETEYAKAKEAEANKEEELEAEPTTLKDERQGELDLRAPRKAAAKATTKKATPAPAQPTSVAPTKEITSTADTWGGTVEFFDGTVGVIKRPHPANGEIQYIPIRADGTFARNLFGVQSVDTLQAAGQNKVFSPAEMATLVTQTADSKAKDTAAEAKFPDGPFTGASSNVVAGKSVDPRYTNYLTDLMKSLGLGDVRVFLYHSADVAGNADKLHIHGSYYPIMARGVAKDSQKGATKPIGPDGKDFMLFVNDNMSEAQALEVIAHELGHMIEKIAYTSAPANVRDAIIDEYDAWLASLKGKKASDLVASLRNRNMAENMEQEGGLDVELSKLSAQDKKYWLGFDEWFADNVSRWATTADKPLTITEKFFSRVGQMMRDLVAVVTGRKFPPNKAVADFLNAMGPGSADLWMSKAQPAGGQVQPLQNAVSFSTESLINGMGPLENEDKPLMRKVIDGFKAGSSPAEPSYATKFRTQTADAAATIENRLREQFDGAVKDKLGKFNPMGLYRQAQDYSKMLLEYMQVGAISKEPATGLWKVKADPKVRPPVEVYALIDKWAAKNGYSRERGTQIASRVLEGVRLDAMRASNKNDGTSFLLHLKDNEIDQLVREYKADPDLQAMSKAMDEARIAMVDNMVAVGRLTKETGDVWKDTVGYVPFDRLEDEKFAAAFSKVKKISNKGLAQVGKLPELVGSEQRPVGNVFDNYLNTLGWMVGQTMKTDATVRTLRSLEDAGHAKFLGRSAQQKPNTVGMYVDGEMMYWELPSKYDVLAFKDLNPPKAKWLQILGQASNILRKAVTVLPPFALKQVTDDVQRAIMTSGVKNPGALLRMTLSNFGGLALAELRGIQHPTVREFGALGLTGEYDFQQGKPASSVLKDLGYKPRGRYETLIHRLDGITRASDLAVRKAIYDQTMKESQGDQLLAQTRAREFINFRRRGASDFVGAMVTTIPFFNAYIQGMDVLYRAASGKDSSSSVGRAQARRMFYSRAAIAMTLSSLYALGKGDDDEDYNEMDLRTRDSNWILPGGFKLPVPTELGALFKVIPERIVEYMRRQGTPEEQEAWEATRTALTYIMEQYVGRVVPVPQGVKPLLEAWTNYSFFTGRELEGIYQKQQDPSLRRASNTSELAIAIANFSKDVIGVDKVSPILIDNALSGYFGSTAGLLVAMTDSLLNPTRVDRPLHKYALIANYMYDPVGTRRMTEFYDEREKVGRANTTLRELMKTDMDKAAEYAEKNADKLMLESAVNSTLEQLERTRAYRKYLNGPLSAEDMSKEEREATIKEVKQMEVQLTSWLREAKTAVRQ